jgi:hypothetical protein
VLGYSSQLLVTKNEQEAPEVVVSFFKATFSLMVILTILDQHTEKTSSSWQSDELFLVKEHEC